MCKTLKVKSSVVCVPKPQCWLRPRPVADGRAPVSQFTLLASTKKGNKPDFHGALGGDEARSLYQYFYAKVQNGYVPEKVKDGVFQAMMQVALVNDGPVCTAPLTFFSGHVI